MRSISDTLCVSITRVRYTYTYTYTYTYRCNRIGVRGKEGGGATYGPLPSLPQDHALFAKNTETLLFVKKH